jgi:hypothetical protein
VILGGKDYGCDDVGPVIDPSDPAWTSREAVVSVGYAAPQAGALAYAYLPSDTSTVVAVYGDGRRSSSGLVISPGGFWAMPITPGDNPDGYIYLNATGGEVART